MNSSNPYSENHLFNVIIIYLKMMVCIYSIFNIRRSFSFKRNKDYHSHASDKETEAQMKESSSQSHTTRRVRCKLNTSLPRLPQLFPQLLAQGWDVCWFEIKIETMIVSFNFKMKLFMLFNLIEAGWSWGYRETRESFRPKLYL